MRNLSGSCGSLGHPHRFDVAGGPTYVPGTAVVGAGDITAQSERIFEIIGAILAAHGASFTDVLHVRTFMTDLDHLAGYGAVRRRYFTDSPPASTTVQVSRLFLPEALVEVEVLAATVAGAGRVNRPGRRLPTT